ncbi:GlsB/YeaQ/YmgE family stress response membrane protein [Actinophytocola sp.]|uniref:GlsB/YeaQ/YmgE family stress response membrane protein n=1 Tax=Actinophytocola sp. TaxID=1872138 RepID=UPI002ED424A8
MSVIGWIVLGLIAGIVAKSLLGGRAKHGVTVTILVGIAGALVGGWAATEFLDLETTGDFFEVSTLIAIVGAVVLLLIHHAITNRGRGANRRSRRGRGVWPARR